MPILNHQITDKNAAFHDYITRLTTAGQMNLAATAYADKTFFDALNADIDNLFTAVSNEYLTRRGGENITQEQSDEISNQLLPTIDGIDAYTYCLGRHGEAFNDLDADSQYVLQCAEIYKALHNRNKVVDMVIPNFQSPGNSEYFTMRPEIVPASTNIFARLWNAIKEAVGLPGSNKERLRNFDNFEREMYLRDHDIIKSINRVAPQEPEMQAEREAEREQAPQRQQERERAPQRTAINVDQIPKKQKLPDDEIDQLIEDLGLVDDLDEVFEKESKKQEKDAGEQLDELIDEILNNDGKKEDAGKRLEELLEDIEKGEKIRDKDLQEAFNMTDEEFKAFMENADKEVLKQTVTGISDDELDKILDELDEIVINREKENTVEEPDFDQSRRDKIQFLLVTSEAAAKESEAKDMEAFFGNYDINQLKECAEKMGIEGECINSDFVRLYMLSDNQDMSAIMGQSDFDMIRKQSYGDDVAQMLLKGNKKEVERMFSDAAKKLADSNFYPKYDITDDFETVKDIQQKDTINKMIGNIQDTVYGSKEYHDKVKNSLGDETFDNFEKYSSNYNKVHNHIVSDKKKTIRSDDYSTAYQNTKFYGQLDEKGKSQWGKSLDSKKPLEYANSAIALECAHNFKEKYGNNITEMPHQYYEAKQQIRNDYINAYKEIGSGDKQKLNEQIVKGEKTDISRNEKVRTSNEQKFKGLGDELSSIEPKNESVRKDVTSEFTEKKPEPVKQELQKEEPKIVASKSRRGL